jgi:hypothetical protein
MSDEEDDGEIYIYIRGESTTRWLTGFDELQRYVRFFGWSQNSFAGI